MPIYGTCDECGGETIDYGCVNCETDKAKAAEDELADLKEKHAAVGKIAADQVVKADRAQELLESTKAQLKRTQDERDELQTFYNARGVSLEKERGEADVLTANMARAIVGIQNARRIGATMGAEEADLAMERVQLDLVGDDIPVEPVRAAPVAIEKVKGDVGFTVLVLVEDDDWSQEDQIRLASNDLLLVPAKEKP